MHVCCINHRRAVDSFCDNELPFSSTLTVSSLSSSPVCYKDDLDKIIPLSGVRIKSAYHWRNSHNAVTHVRNKNYTHSREIS